MKRIQLFFSALLVLASLASAQEPVNPALRPPKGAQIAIVTFEDLECPDCRRATPLLEEAAKTYKIPLIFHDFPLPFHQWSFDAAVTARYVAGDGQAKADAAGQRVARCVEPDKRPEHAGSIGRRNAGSIVIDQDVDPVRNDDPR